MSIVEWTTIIFRNFSYGSMMLFKPRIVLLPALKSQAVPTNLGPSYTTR